MSDTLFPSILYQAAGPGQRVYVRLGSWPQDQWVAMQRTPGQRLALVEEQVGHPAPLQWRSATRPAGSDAT